MTKSLYTLYRLVDPRTDEVRYVGQTTNTPAVRLSSHISAARSGRFPSGRTAVASWIRDLLNLGLRPIIEIAWTTPNKKRVGLTERFLIQKHRATCLNVGPGSDRYVDLF